MKRAVPFAVWNSAEFIRKNDYQVIAAGFGKEGNAWLRAVSMIAGSRKSK